MNLKTYLAERKELVDIELGRLLNDDHIPNKLQKAMMYSLEAGGKRIRPILVIAGAEAVGGKASDVMDIACALEVIHTFSLIHDDLPAMDDDDLRRGKPTNHKAFDEATAILAGDALLAEAFYILVRSVKAKENIKMLEVISDIAKAAGARGMTGGQQIDMDSVGKKIGENELTNLHRLKTGELIVVSVVSGAKYLGANDKQINALKIYGEAVGLAFQIADDILDIEGNEDEIGKDVGSDVGNNKATFPSIIGLEESRTKAKKLIEEAIAVLNIFDEKADSLRTIARYIIDRRS